LTTQAQFFSRCVLSTIADVQPYVTTLNNALCFQPYLQTLSDRFWEFEVAIPLGSVAADPTKPDFLFVRKVWWDIVDLVHTLKADYKSATCHVVRLNITKASEVTMATQNFQGKANWVLSLGFAVIPHLTTLLDWHEFAQHVVDTLSNHVDLSANPIKFHWGKQNDIFVVNSRTYYEYAVKTAFSGQISRFRKDLKAISTSGGTKFKHNVQCFSTPAVDFLIGESSKLPPTAMDTILTKKKKKKGQRRPSATPARSGLAESSGDESSFSGSFVGGGTSSPKMSPRVMAVDS